MSSKNIVLLALLFLVISINNTQAGNVIEDQPLRPGIAVFSLHPEFNVIIPIDGSTRLGIDQLDEYFDQLDATWVERTFPHCLPPVPNGTDLSTIYTVYFPETITVRDVCQDLTKFDVVD